LRAVAYSSDPDSANEHRGVVKWIDSVLNGFLETSYTHQANVRLGLEDTPPGLPETGTPWMEHDGLDAIAEE
jgi:hypothetical protein